MVTDSMSENVATVSYSQGEDELGQIENQLTAISTSSEFFEQEKLRQKMKREEEKAQNIRESMLVGEDVPKRDINWLKKYDEAIYLAANPQNAIASEVAFAETEEIVSTEENELAFLEEDPAHIEDEIPFEAEADDDGSSEEGHV